MCLEYLIYDIDVLPLTYYLEGTIFVPIAIVQYIKNHSFCKLVLINILILYLGITFVIKEGVPENKFNSVPTDSWNENELIMSKNICIKRCRYKQN